MTEKSIQEQLDSIQEQLEEIKYLLHNGYGFIGRYDLAKEVTKYMREIGIPVDVKGYGYIREAILMTFVDRSVLTQVMKILYPGIAKKFGTTPSKVEKAIRTAIEITWSRGNWETIKGLFGYSANREKRPSNSEFIALITDQICLDNNLV